MLTLAKNANLALALAIEFAILAAFAAWPFSLGIDLWLRIGLAAALVAAVAAVWSRWAAPRSPARLGLPVLVMLKLVLSVLATLALVAGGWVATGAAFAILAVVNLGLAAIWRQL